MTSPPESPATALRRVNFPVSGMSCAACAASVQKLLESVPGVEHAEVHFGARAAELEIDPSRTEESALRAALSGTGYGMPSGALEGRALAEDVAYSESQEAQSRREELRSLALAVTCLALVLVAGALEAPVWVDVVLAAPAVVLAGRGILLSGWRAALRRAPDMDSLVGMGVASAWLAGLGGALAPDLFGMAAHHVHAALMILSFVLFGRWLEGRARSRAGEAVRALLDLAPPTAIVLRGGEEREVPLSEVQTGNLVIVRPGSRIPVDGEVLDGASTVDESMLTGESFPIERGPGERVHAGTMNGQGALSVKVTGVGADSALGRITEAVHRAQASRAPIQRLADRISGVFVPVVLGLAALTFAIWLTAAGLAPAISHTVAVLVIACPCALGLATPTAMVVAGGRGAQEGLLLRNASAVEHLAAVDTMVFDKTGTLTQGHPELRTFERLDGVPPEDALLARVAGVERKSEQPLARALVEAARARGLSTPTVRGFLAEPGIGVSAEVAGVQLWIGSPRGAIARGHARELVEGTLGPLLKRGETPVLVEEDGKLVARLGLFDKPRPDAKAVIAELRAMGLEPRLLSGDHESAARALADELGIAEARGRLSPEEKSEAVAEMVDAGRTVAMVGDGVNDAPALARADVGIAMGGGADVAIESADCALLRDELGRLPVLVRLARRTLRIIRGNLFWAFAYNVLALPVAAGVFESSLGLTVSPRWAAAAMAASSVLVVGNSLRLRWVRLESRATA